MEFRIPLRPAKLPSFIEFGDGILLSGSCFTEHMAERMRRHKFRVLENPNGVLFNPVSIASSLVRAIDGEPYTPSDLFHAHGLWSNWDFHGRFSDPDAGKALDAMNASVEQTHGFLRESRWLFLTLGSAWVYQLGDGRIVANCHKAPDSSFIRRLLAPEEVLSALDNLIHRLSLINPDMQLILTVSPVRHMRDGYVENNRSKAVLLQAVHHLAGKFDGIHYFPAYELVIDDLRDYRFYAEDMVHPNHQATTYVWERFVESAFSGSTREAMREIAGLGAAMAHRPLHPGSTAHRDFMRSCLEKTLDLSRRFSSLDFTEEFRCFGSDSGSGS
jgi:hypothetical protein